MGKPIKKSSLFCLSLLCICGALGLSSCLPPLVTKNLADCFNKEELKELRRSEAANPAPKATLFLSPMLISSRDSCVGLYAFDLQSRDSVRGYTDCLMRMPDGSLLRSVQDEDSLRSIRRTLRQYFRKDSLELVMIRLKIGQVASKPE